jgi:hypothetical protein
MKNNLIFLFLILLCSVPVSAQCLPVDGLVNIRSCGAIPDDNLDDAPAIQASLDALVLTGGGVLDIPSGRYEIGSEIARDFLNTTASHIVVRGRGSASTLHITAGNDKTALWLSNTENIAFEDLSFVGTPGVTNDAKITLQVDYVKKLFFKNVTFYGLQASQGGGAVLKVTGSELNTQNLAFRGCTGFYPNKVAVMVVDNWVGGSMRDTDFIDYGVLNGVYYSKTGALSLAWLTLGTPRQFNEPIFIIDRAYLDEGAAAGIVADSRGTPTHLHFSGINQNVNGTDLGRGIVVNGAKSLRVSNSWFGFAAQGTARNAVEVYGTDSASLSDIVATNDAHRILVGASVRNFTLNGSTIGTLQSNAKNNIVMNSMVKEMKIATSSQISVSRDGKFVSGTSELPTDYRTEFYGGGTNFRGIGQTSEVVFSNNSANMAGNGVRYTYYIVAVDSSGRRSEPRAAVHTNGWKALTNYAGGCCWHSISWAPVPGASSYVVMRGTTSQLIGTTTTTSIIDRGQPATPYSPPAWNETAIVNVEGPVKAEEYKLGPLNWTFGADAPTLTCVTGSLYSRTDGVAGATFYVCEAGKWVAK